MQTVAMANLESDAVAAADFVTATVSQLLLIGAGIGLAMMLTGVLATWFLVRRVRRSRRIRRKAQRVGITARSYVSDSAGRRIAAMRLDLRRHAEATERSLAAARAQGRPVGDLPLVAAQLETSGQLIDDQLSLAEREPDRQLKGSMAAMLQGQVERLARASAELRQALLSSGRAVGDAGMQQISDSLSMEIDALQAWTGSYSALSPGTPHHGTPLHASPRRATPSRGARGRF
jgi:hypothetical protein